MERERWNLIYFCKQKTQQSLFSILFIFKIRILLYFSSLVKYEDNKTKREKNFILLFSQINFTPL